MKKKLIIITILGALITIIIYNFTIDNRLKLLALGDGLANGMTAYNVSGYSYNDYIKDEFKNINQLYNYNNIFTKKDLTVAELIRMINNNESNKLNNETITIQQAIAEANVITVAIGLDELANHSLNNTLNKRVINSYFSELNVLFQQLRKYNREKIIVVGLYKAYELEDIDSINKEIKKVANKNECEFIDISKVVQNEEYYFDNTSYYLNYKGHKKISAEVLKLI